MAARLKIPFATRDPHIYTHQGLSNHSSFSPIWSGATVPLWKLREKENITQFSHEVNIYLLLFNCNYSRLLMREKLTWLGRAREAKCGTSSRRPTFICLLSLSNCALSLKVHKHEIFFSSDSASYANLCMCRDPGFWNFSPLVLRHRRSFSLSKSTLQNKLPATETTWN